MNEGGLRRDGKELQDGAFGAAPGGQVAEIAVAAEVAEDRGDGAAVLVVPDDAVARSAAIVTRRPG